MRKRWLAMLLVLCMAASLLPMQAMAVTVGNGSGLSSLGIREISGKAYSVTPDVLEYEWILNNSGLTQQMVGHVMEVKVGEGSTAGIATGYSDYNIDAIKSGKNWAMLETTKQAQNMQTRRGVNVVGAVNASGYDMSNGRPSGAFVMNGTLISKATGTTFWIDKSGNAHISAVGEYNAEFEAGNVAEAVSAFGNLVQDGKAISGLDNATRASRTAIGIKPDGKVVVFMVDGRQAPYSVGMTMAETAAAMEDLGCEIAINLDGGGSSTFATQREGESENDDAAGLTVRCRPSDGYERKVASTLMVISTATATGTFDHAAITPNDEVYTPGSTVQFTATGVDASGNAAALPEYVGWTVISGGGSIDENGMYTAEEGTTGDVTVAMTSNGENVGQATIHMQWPDKLGFTNSSVSLDFGASSNLTFEPTWQGRKVNYKDGDFVWSVDTNGLSYKYSAKLEQYYTPFWQAAAVRWAQLSMSLTGAEVGSDMHLTYNYDDMLLYDSVYTVSDRTITTLSDGTVQVEETLTHKTGTLYSQATSGLVLKENVTENFEATELSDKKSYGIKNLNVENTFTFSLGSFVNNTFTADDETSLRGTINVALSSDPTVTGSVGVVVGMEPYMLMDFESKDGVSAETYWSCHVGASSAGTSGQLTADEVKADRIWVRDTTGKGTKFPEGYNKVVSSAEDENVRFGQYAFKLGYNFTDVLTTNVGVAELGFSGDLLVDTVQPTKIGMWIKVPEECANDNSVLKAILKGAAYKSALATAYMELESDGSMTYHDGYQLTGTAAYVQYYSYNADGTVSGSTLADWAGKDWTWVEADISAFQMPLDVCRGYTVRVTSPLNCTKSTGYLYVDNIQFIYGTNTNDITRPVLESVTETGSGTVLASDGSTVLTSSSLSFTAVYSDSELVDKYASGIDAGGIKVLVDGVDCTNDVEINSGSLYLKGLSLRNGTHTLTIRLKDFYGNVTTESFRFTVEDEAGTEAGISLLPQAEAPEIGEEFALWIVNQTGEDVTAAELVIDMPAKYLEGARVEPLGDYTLTLDESAMAKGQAHITITKNEAQNGIMMASLEDLYDYDSELGYLIITIPESAASDSKLTYTVSKGEYTSLDEEGNETTSTFSDTEQSIDLTASYLVSCDVPIIGEKTTITVTDSENKPASRVKVYLGEKVIGTTGANGKITYTFETAGEQTIYAKGNKGRSWNLRVIVCEKTAENDGKPFGILTNGTENAAGCQSVSWISAIETSKAQAQVRYGTDAELTDAKTVNGTSEIVTFVQSTTGEALRSNRARISGLTAGTTYYYQVGDGETWSETLSFTTANADGDTNFFILGDIQSTDTANLASVLGSLKAQDTKYDFAIQTGDAIDNVTEYVKYWRPFFTTLNSDTLDGADLIHALGNHEYYGDAEGSISGKLYDLPSSAQNSWYKMEYGRVCVVVINNGTNLAAAVADIAGNLETDCVWKVLVTHEPIYGTNPSSEEIDSETIANIENAGFDFVFGGDDHAYARTKPMLSGEVTEDVRHGVVYYVCGDLSSKTNDYKERECYAAAIPHTSYTGMYMTVSATEESMTVSAWKYDGSPLDTYTKARTDCELGRHTYDETSKYNMEDGTLSCVICGETGAATEAGYNTGLFKTTDGKLTILNDGVPKKGEFTNIGEKTYHSCADGYAAEAKTSDSRTCVKGGYTTDTCPVCKASQKSQFLYPAGHDWDKNHKCKKCGFEGIDIAGDDVVFFFGTPENPRTATGTPNYAFTDVGVRPSSFAKHGDHVLTYSNDDNVGSDGAIKDLFVLWPDNKSVGKAKIVYYGKGDYYGTVELEYVIVPNSVTAFTTSNITPTSAKLTWTAAAGAQYYDIYSCDKSNTSSSRKCVGRATGCEYTLTGLTAESETYYVVAGRAAVEAEGGKVYNSPRWSPICTVTTSAYSADVTDVSATVDGREISLANISGTNYLFLPSSADISELSLKFTRSAEEGTLIISGDKDKQCISGDSAQLNLGAIASQNNGVWEITASVGNGQSLKVSIMQASNIPTIYLSSSDPATQGRSYVDVSKSNKTTGSVLMVGADGTTICSIGVTQLRARGNSTLAYADKKSYQIKLQEKSDLLQNGENVKTWVLLANYFDATLMHDKLFKDLAAEMSMSYTASSGWVSLYYDGEYRGVYQLSEKNSVGGTGVDITDMEDAYGRLNSEYGTDMQAATATNSYGLKYQYTQGLMEPENITGGYLLELNHDSYDEVSGFITGKGKGINVKSPEWCGNDAVKYISEYYQAFENAVYATDENGKYTGYNADTGKYYYEYVDRDSLVKVFLLQELALSPDGFISSLYFYKDADDIMYAGPIWDQDITLGTGWTKQISPDITDYHYLAEALIQIPDFRKAVEEYYNNSFAPLIKSLVAKGGAVDKYTATLSGNADMNYKLWPYIRIGDPSNEGHLWEGADYSSVITDLRAWLTSRVSYMDKAFAPSSVTGDVDGDGEITSDDAVFILQYLADALDDTVQFNADAADMDCDGEITSDDAVAILQYLAE